MGPASRKGCRPLSIAGEAPTSADIPAQPRGIVTSNVEPNAKGGPIMGDKTPKRPPKPKKPKPSGHSG